MLETGDLFKTQQTFSDKLFKEVGERLHKNVTNNNLDNHIIHYKDYAGKRSY